MIFKLPSNLTALINQSQISHNKLDGKKIKKDLNKKDNLIFNKIFSFARHSWLVLVISIL